MRVAARPSRIRGRKIPSGKIAMAKEVSHIANIWILEKPQVLRDNGAFRASLTSDCLGVSLALHSRICCHGHFLTLAVALKGQQMKEKICWDSLHSTGSIMGAR